MPTVFVPKSSDVSDIVLLIKQNFGDGDLPVALVFDDISQARELFANGRTYMLNLKGHDQRVLSEVEYFVEMLRRHGLPQRVVSKPAAGVVRYEVPDFRFRNEGHLDDLADKFETGYKRGERVVRVACEEPEFPNCVCHPRTSEEAKLQEIILDLLKIRGVPIGTFTAQQNLGYQRLQPFSRYLVYHPAGR